MSEWIVLDDYRAINLAHVSDIKFVSDGGLTYATVHLSCFDPTTGEREGLSSFNVRGADLERLRACIERRLAPEFADRLGSGGPHGGRQRDARLEAVAGS